MYILILFYFNHSFYTFLLFLKSYLSTWELPSTTEVLKRTFAFFLWIIKKLPDTFHPYDL